MAKCENDELCNTYYQTKWLFIASAVIPVVCAQIMACEESAKMSVSLLEISLR